MQSITYFTPTFNRGYCIGRLYDAFKRQTNKDFVWLIVDDGSTDNTKKLVESWIDSEKTFEIKYIQKENGGLHTGYNTAIANIETPLASCLDTSSWLVDDANERTLKYWEKSKQENLLGLLGYHEKTDGSHLGFRFADEKVINYIDLFTGRLGVGFGDMQVVLRTSAYKKVAPQQSYGNEKNFNPSYMILKAAIECPNVLVMPETLAIVEYQPGGLTMSGPFIAYWHNPQSFAELRRLFMTLPNAPVRYVIRQCVHYVSHSIRAKDCLFLKNSPRPIISFFSIPLGCLLYVMTYFRVKKLLEP